MNSTPQSFESTGKTILIIDDEPAIREVTRRMLEYHGFKVFVAVDGLDGVSEFMTRKDEIDVVISDMVMPNMDGPTAMKTIASVAPDLVMVAVSGHHTNSMFDEARAAGVRHFLKKPFDTATLLSTIHMALATAV